MTRITAHLSISLDGYVAGPDQSQDNPLGIRGFDLHGWHTQEVLHEVDAAINERLMAPRGAYVMGRNMYGPVRGDWDDADGGEMWRGWWGDEPPYHCPVFVVTHHPHDPVEMKGGTTFYFVTDFDEAVRRAVDVAGDDTVTLAGGASVVRQGLAAGIVDEIMLNHIPVVLGGGEHLFEGLEKLRMQPLEAHSSPNAVHVVYAIEREVS